MSKTTRRTILRGIALSLTAGGVLDTASAQHVHETAAAEKAKGLYKPKAFQPHQYKTIQRLAELIVPKDERSGSALDAGAPEFIDLLCSQNKELANIYYGGLAWLDAEMRRRHGKAFTDVAGPQQVAMLDLLVAAERTERTRRAEESVYERSSVYRDFAGYSTHARNDLAPGVVFFDWIRKMTVDAFYTSPMGVKDVEFKGNGAYSKYEVPVAALQYALKRSPFGGA
ncbi:MAG: gluconate 2-dehydrogenase subunit 3 family protein [Bryobacterales bacterium]|nr:gluconate 2-dehydrogenase subunit 3 family protein [Bryobacterales bacterium]